MRRDRNPLLVVISDKYAVKQFAARRGVQTAKLLHVTEHPNDIPFDELPERCFIKANHASGWNILSEGRELYNFGHGDHLIAANGALVRPSEGAPHRLSRDECIRRCGSWLGRDYSRSQWAYRRIRRKIVVEAALTPRVGGQLEDFRLYAFHGRVRAINVGSPAYRRRRRNAFFDPEWRLFRLTRFKEALPDPLPERPEPLAEMIATAEALARDIDFVRVDLYDTTEGIVLGEMTVYPEAGKANTPTACPVFNRWLGEEWIGAPRWRAGGRARLPQLVASGSDPLPPTALTPQPQQNSGDRC